MLPDIASSISESVGCGLLASKAEADMIWPDWAVPALTALAVEPAFLDLGARHCRADRLDRRDRGGANAVDRGDAGTGGDAVDMHGAGAAERHAAAELRAGHAEHVAQNP